MTLTLKPISFKEANAYVALQHRHHKPVQGGKFCIAAIDGDKVVGVAITGRPVCRHLDNGYTAEVTRLCTDGTYNACSLLYSASARAAKAMGYTKIQTYILEDEKGTSLKASGWTFEQMAGGGDWNAYSKTGRRTDQPMIRKQRWARSLY